MSYFNGPKITTDQLFLCLDAANNKSYPGTGIAWTDLSENGNNSSLINGVSYASSNKGSMFFDGTNDHVDTPFHIPANGLCSFGCWMKAPDANQRCGLIGFRSAFTYLDPTIYQCLIYITGDFNALTSGKGIIMQDWSGGYIGTTFSIQKNHSVNALSTIVCDNKWHYIFVVRTTASTKLFVDNLLVGETSTALPDIGTDSVFKIGVAGNGGTNNLGGYYFSGNISSVYFYDRSLADAEVIQNYNAIKGRYYV